MTNKKELTYCEECVRNLEDDKFDYRFNRPVCLECVEQKNLDPEKECEDHTWNLWLADKENRCEECGATEPADANDIAEQHRLLAELDASVARHPAGKGKNND